MKKKAKKATKTKKPLKRKIKSAPKKSAKNTKSAKKAKTKKVNKLSGERLFRDKEFTTGYRDPTQDINGASENDGYDRAELNVKDRENSPKDQDFVEDFDGDEDFYGDDEENQSGAKSYSDDKQPYIGKGDWVDSRYGDNQYNHKDDVEYQKRQEVDASAGFRKKTASKSSSSETIQKPSQQPKSRKR